MRVDDTLSADDAIIITGRIASFAPFQFKGYMFALGQLNLLFPFHSQFSSLGRGHVLTSQTSSAPFEIAEPTIYILQSHSESHSAFTTYADALIVSIDGISLNEHWFVGCQHNP